MATINFGKVRIAHKGAFSPTATYTVLDCVEYEGSAYLCIKDATAILPTNTDYWSLLVSKGDKGEKGDQGEQGIQGITGVYASSIYEFPNVGNINSVYVCTTDNSIYRWEESTQSYICVGRDFTSITVINGGTANG